MFFRLSTWHVFRQPIYVAKYTSHIYQHPKGIITLQPLDLRHWGRVKMAAISQRNFQRIFIKENVRISIHISLKFVANGQINNIPALVQIMAWRWLPALTSVMICRFGAKPLSFILTNYEIAFRNFVCKLAATVFSLNVLDDPSLWFPQKTITKFSPFWEDYYQSKYRGKTNTRETKSNITATS